VIFPDTFVFCGVVSFFSVLIFIARLISMTLVQDVIALTIQGVGGGLAATAASSSNPNANPNTGGNVMLVGIVFQMVALIAYLSLAAEFIIRYLYEKPIQRAHTEPPSGNYTLDKNLKTMLSALIFGSVLLFIRYAGL
jgi:RTA1 like protein